MFLERLPYLWLLELTQHREFDNLNDLIRLHVAVLADYLPDYLERLILLALQLLLLLRVQCSVTLLCPLLLLLMLTPEVLDVAESAEEEVGVTPF